MLTAALAQAHTKNLLTKILKWVPLNGSQILRGATRISLGNVFGVPTPRDLPPCLQARALTRSESLRSPPWLVSSSAIDGLIGHIDGWDNVMCWAELSIPLI
jgi:hypothetical protein